MPKQFVPGTNVQALCNTVFSDREAKHVHGIRDFSIATLRQVCCETPPMTPARFAEGSYSGGDRNLSQSLLRHRGPKPHRDNAKLCIPGPGHGEGKSCGKDGQ